MIRRVVSTSVAVLFLALAAPFTLQAQNIFIMGGATIPTGDDSDAISTGWMAAGGVSFDIGEEGLFAGVEGTYGRNSADDSGFLTDQSVKPYSVMGFLGYSFPTEGNVDPYIFGGAGIFGAKWSGKMGGVDVDDSHSEFGYQFGVGVSFGSETSSTRPFVEGRYQAAGGEIDGGFIGAFVGLSFGVGN